MPTTKPTTDRRNLSAATLAVKAGRVDVARALDLAAGALDAGEKGLGAGLYACAREFHAAAIQQLFAAECQLQADRPSPQRFNGSTLRPARA